MKANPREPRVTAYLYGGPAHGREYQIDMDLVRHGVIKVLVEREAAHDYLQDPFKVTTISADVAIYERSRVPGRWTFARIEGQR